jgi:hypothetical protein
MRVTIVSLSRPCGVLRPLVHGVLRPQVHDEEAALAQGRRLLPSPSWSASARFGHRRPHKNSVSRKICTSMPHTP